MVHLADRQPLLRSMMVLLLTPPALVGSTIWVVLLVVVVLMLPSVLAWYAQNDHFWALIFCSLAIHLSMA